MDHSLLATMDAWRHPALTAGFAALTWLGSLFVLLPLAIWMARHHAIANRSRLFLPLAVVGAALVGHALKLAFDRPRPDLFAPLIDMPADASFPSAHAMQVTAFVIAWLLWSGRIRQTAWLTSGIIVILLVGLSRIYLQVHYPSDVAFGMLCGLVWVLLLHALPIWRRSF